MACTSKEFPLFFRLIVFIIIFFLCSDVCFSFASPIIINRQFSNISELTEDDKTVAPSPTDVERIYHQPLSVFLPLDNIKEIIIPSSGADISEERIGQTLLHARIVRYKELRPIAMLPPAKIQIKTADDKIFYVCLFLEDSAEDRGRIIFPDGKSYWFAIPTDEPHSQCSEDK